MKNLRSVLPSCGLLKGSLLLLVLVLVLLGAVVAGAGADEPEEATETFAGYSMDQVWTAAVTVLSRKLVVMASDRKAGTLRAEAMAGMVPIGEVFEIVLRPVAAGTELQIVNVKHTRIQVDSLVPTLMASIQAELTGAQPSAKD